MEILIILISVISGILLIISMYFHFKELDKKISKSSNNKIMTEDDLDNLSSKIIDQMLSKNLTIVESYKYLDESIEYDEINSSENIIDFKSKVEEIKNVG